MIDIQTVKVLLLPEYCGFVAVIQFHGYNGFTGVFMLQMSTLLLPELMSNVSQKLRIST